MTCFFSKASSWALDRLPWAGRQLVPSGGHQEKEHRLMQEPLSLPAPLLFEDVQGREMLHEDVCSTSHSRGHARAVQEGASHVARKTEALLAAFSGKPSYFQRSSIHGKGRLEINAADPGQLAETPPGEPRCRAVSRALS